MMIVERVMTGHSSLEWVIPMHVSKMKEKPLPF